MESLAYGSWLGIPHCLLFSDTGFSRCRLILMHVFVILHIDYSARSCRISEFINTVCVHTVIIVVLKLLFEEYGLIRHSMENSNNIIGKSGHLGLTYSTQYSVQSNFVIKTTQIKAALLYQNLLFCSLKYIFLHFLPQNFL